MRWHKGTDVTHQQIVRVNALFNQVHASQLVPRDSGPMTYIDIHTAKMGAEGEGPVYRVFSNGAIDIGIEGEAEEGAAKVSREFFITMTVEYSTGFGKTEKANYHKTVDVFPEDTVENLYWRAWNALAKEHRFDGHTSRVTAWDIKRNEIADL